MDNKRRFLKFEAQDFLEIKPLDEVACYKGAIFES